MEFKFTPSESDFDWVREYEDGSSVLVGRYHVGGVYNCTKSPRHDALREKCKEWEAAGKIIIFPLPPSQHFVSQKSGE